MFYSLLLIVSERVCVSFVQVLVIGVYSTTHSPENIYIFDLYMCFSVFVIIQFLNLVLISFWLKFLFCDFRIVTNRCFRLLIVTSLIFQLSWVIRLCRSISINNKMCPNIFGDLFVSSLQFVFAFMTNNSSLQFELNNKQQFEFCFTFLHVFTFFRLSIPNLLWWNM